MDFIFKNILTSSANYDTVEEHPLLRYPSFRVIISLSKETEFRRHGESEINHGDIEINHGDIEISHGDIEMHFRLITVLVWGLSICRCKC